MKNIQSQEPGGAVAAAETKEQLKHHDHPAYQAGLIVAEELLRRARKNDITQQVVDELRNMTGDEIAEKIGEAQAQREESNKIDEVKKTLKKCLLNISYEAKVVVILMFQLTNTDYADYLTEIVDEICDNFEVEVVNKAVDISKTEPQQFLTTLAVQSLLWRDNH